MGVLADTLGGKAAGELIRAIDWNDLIDAIEGIEERLDSRITTLASSVDDRLAGVDAAITGLDGRVQGLEDRVAEIDADLTAFRQHFRRVTLQTDRTRYALGELAQITGRVTDLDGSPLDLGDAASRPWIDFVTVWGQLKPVAGFESRGGAGDRTISVRVNAEGIARVVLRAEHAEGFSDEAEAEVAASLEIVPAGAQVSIRDAILAAPTPMGAREQGAFRVLTEEYNRSDASGLRAYTDGYYLKNPAVGAADLGIIAPHLWRDHRSTVIAIAKADADPLTPDSGLGTCSIQLTFRDWIGPWINLDFIPDLGPLVAEYADRFRARIGPDYAVTIDRFQDEVQSLLGGRGVIGKQKHARAIREAVDQMTVTDPPPFLPDVTQVILNGLAVEQAAGYAQTAALGVGEAPLTFLAFTSSAARADARATEVQQEVTGLVTQQLGQAQEELAFEVQRQQASFRDEIFAESGPIQGVQRNLQAVVGQVQGFQVALNAKADVQALARFLPR